MDEVKKQKMLEEVGEVEGVKWTLCRKFTDRAFCARLYDSTGNQRNVEKVNTASWRLYVRNTVPRQIKSMLRLPGLIPL